MLVRILNRLRSRRNPARPLTAYHGLSVQTGIRAGGVIGNLVSYIPPSLRSYG